MVEEAQEPSASPLHVRKVEQGTSNPDLNEGGLEDLLAPRTLTGLQRDSPVLNDVSVATSRRPAEVMVPKALGELGCHVLPPRQAVRSEHARAVASGGR